MAGDFIKNILKGVKNMKKGSLVLFVFLVLAVMTIVVGFSYANTQKGITNVDEKIKSLEEIISSLRSENRTLKEAVKEFAEQNRQYHNKIHVLTVENQELKDVETVLKNDLKKAHETWIKQQKLITELISQNE